MRRSGRPGRKGMKRGRSDEGDVLCSVFCDALFFAFPSIASAMGVSVPHGASAWASQAGGGREKEEMDGRRSSLRWPRSFLSHLIPALFACLLSSRSAPTVGCLCAARSPCSQPSHPCSSRAVQAGVAPPPSPRMRHPPPTAAAAHAHPHPPRGAWYPPRQLLSVWTGLRRYHPLVRGPGRGPSRRRQVSRREGGREGGGSRIHTKPSHTRRSRAGRARHALPGTRLGV